MILEHVGLSQINGSLVVLDGVQNASYDEMVVMKLTDGSQRVGRIVMIEGDKCVIQVFEGTTGFSLDNTRTTLSGHPMMVDLARKSWAAPWTAWAAPSTAWVRFILSSAAM